jgi:predicted ATPase/transcriptional regulator with XRE-family HTH domain
MQSRNIVVSPDHFTQFGELLEYLRRRVGLTQRELSIAVGYSDSQISRLEHNQRVPDRTTLTALFVPALDLSYEPKWTARLLELAVEARRAEASTLGTHQTPSHNLPLQLTSFLGRETEIVEVIGLLSPASGMLSDDTKIRHRLVTLTGPGGVGKTRLAIQIAFKLADQYPDGIWIIDLAPLADPAMVPQTVAAILGLREEGSQSMHANLISHLQTKTSLLLLDNCEHLIDACAHLTADVLQACPNVSILATSREALGIAGELPFLVEPLSVPDLEHFLSIESLIKYEGVRLFVERAKAAFPGFKLNADNSPAVGEVCCRLDGLPLAIELAAARVNVLSVTQIAERLADSFRLLGRGNRTAPVRSQTLWACMDWSYNLLSDAERRLLNRLAVFVGGWTLEAAEYVCTDDHIRPHEIIGLLAQLVEKSLVVVDRRPNGLRYRFLETIRQYALEKLSQSDNIATLKDEHLDYYLRLIEREKLEQYGYDILDGLNRVEADHDNLRAALEWSLTSYTDRTICFRLLKQLSLFWESRGFLDEGRKRLSAALTIPEASALTLERAELLFQSAWLAIYQSDLLAGLPLLEESRTIFRQLHPMGLSGEADVLNSMAAIEIDNGDARIALKHAQKALEIATEINYPIGVNWAHHMLGVALGHLGEYDQAWKHLEAAVHSHNRKRGMPSYISMLQSQGELAVWQGDYEKGKPYLEKSLRLAREAKDKWMIGAILGTQGWIALRLREFERVRQLFGESIAIRQEIGDKGGIAWCLEKLAESAALQGASEKATRILGKAASLRFSINSKVNSADKPEYERLLSSLHERIEPEMFQSAWQAGAAIPLETAINLALEA